MNGVAKAISKMLRRLGEPVTVVLPEETVTTVALVYPISSVAEAARTMHQSCDGVYAPGSYAYFGPPDTDIGVSRYLVINGRTYFVRRSEIIAVAGKNLYCWGLLLGGMTNETAGCCT